MNLVFTLQNTYIRLFVLKCLEKIIYFIRCFDTENLEKGAKLVPHLSTHHSVQT